MQVNHDKAKLHVKLERNFNLAAIRELQEHIDKEINCLIIDLENSFFLDSEAIIFMHRWMKTGNKLKLLNPPEVIYEILEVLGIKESWKLDEIIEQKTNSNYE